MCKVCEEIYCLRYTKMARKKKGYSWEVQVGAYPASFLLTNWFSRSHGVQERLMDRSSKHLCLTTPGTGTPGEGRDYIGVQGHIPRLYRQCSWLPQWYHFFPPIFW